MGTLINWSDLMLEKLQALAKNLENRIAQSLANHNALLGYSNAIQDAIKLRQYCGIQGIWSGII